ncbi:glycosyltransferase family 4 protein [Acidisoma silvae]|uniref:Glycosyltransferase family 4 protein n=1 Tax=Acidisoma silvae TaxID=2802396 RepID=A0A964E0Z1_9PROT|nr:glycosyltransferase family 4 protein [Acidisoma silvae]MCB8877816.1 glycosyltransferase family 4 protein [Acidisoma silvae]
MNDFDEEYDYPETVSFEINDQCIDDYVAAADFLNLGRWQVVSLQHEFGIFGGEAGSHILGLLSRLAMPVVTTFHTVLEFPSPGQRNVMEKIIARSSKIIVMAKKGHELLRSVYKTPENKIEVIPHGIPDFAFVEPEAAKIICGFPDKQVILTFGLLSPNKGIEVMIDAMPKVLERCPSAVYVVLGATHPNLIRTNKEAYRSRLIDRTKALGLESSIIFLDQFVDVPKLLTYISMCDVYVTPYLDEAQMTSGTLAYSFGLGKPVVSTPYWHARELLADNRGTLVPFGDSSATANAIVALLTSDARRQMMRDRAYAASRPMTWPRTAKRMLAAFDASQAPQLDDVGISDISSAAPFLPNDLPPLSFIHLSRMCDDTGLLQHAVHAVPNRAHGYCTDDNSRALILVSALNGLGEIQLPDSLVEKFIAFIQHAWNADLKRFRNFMSYGREWLDSAGSEDSHGRTLWALAAFMASNPDPSYRQWALELFIAALPVADNFTSPRAWASTLLGLDHYCSSIPNDSFAQDMRLRLANRLMSLRHNTATPTWAWFEHSLSYDNARLPQALIVTGAAVGNSDYVEAGLSSLDWLIARQTSATGKFQPVGTQTFGQYMTLPKPFDQQPIEATATISACLAAWRSNGDAVWQERAMRSFAWFHGSNDLALTLANSLSGGCHDGLHPDRMNENQGAESTLCYLLSLTELREIAIVERQEASNQAFEDYRREA